MKLIFKPEDFEIGLSYLNYNESKIACIKAQSVFNKWLSEQKVVFGTLAFVGNDGQLTGEKFELVDKPYQTHKAILVCIEPIENCKHPWSKIKAEVPIEKGFFKAKEFIVYQCECGAKVKPSSFEEVV